MRNLIIVLGRRLLLLKLQLANQAQDMRPLLNRVIEFKDDFGHKTHSQTPGQLAAQEARRVMQGLDRLSLLVKFPHDAHINLRVAQVAAHLNVGHAGEAHAGVLDACAQQIAHLDSDLLTQFLLPVWIWHNSLFSATSSFYAPGRTFSWVKASITSPTSKSEKSSSRMPHS